MTGLPLNNKVINLLQLQGELLAAGLAINALGTADDTLFTYDAQGQPTDFADPTTAAAVLAAHVPAPDPALVQRVQDAATLLNSAAVRDTPEHRAAFARLIQVVPLTIPLSQDATPADIHPYTAP